MSTRAWTPAAQTEAQFQQAVTELAEVLGYQVLHVRRSVVRSGRWATATSVAGWPDLTIWGHGRFLLAELKSDRGRLSAAQEQVIDSLRGCGLDVHVWRPADWPEIENTLRSDR